jgi:hypothetical protein
MSDTAPRADLSDRDRALLVALADGELRGSRRARAQARAAEIPGGALLLERQRRVRGALRDGPVPGAAAFAPRTPAPARVPRSLRVALVGVAAAILLALGLAGLPTDRTSLTSEAAALAGAPATAPAPQPTGPILQASVDGVPFPNWGPKFGWHQTGSRHDTLSGRATTTVFYEHMGHRIAYTILPGAPVDPPPDARVVRRAGLEIALLRDGDRDIALFERNGRTCILAGHVEHTTTLVKLAAWTGGR